MQPCSTARRVRSHFARQTVLLAHVAIDHADGSAADSHSYRPAAPARSSGGGRPRCRRRALGDWGRFFSDGSSSSRAISTATRAASRPRRHGPRHGPRLDGRDGVGDRRCRWSARPATPAPALVGDQLEVIGLATDDASPIATGASSRSPRPAPAARPAPSSARGTDVRDGRRRRAPPARHPAALASRVGHSPR